MTMARRRFHCLVLLAAAVAALLALGAAPAGATFPGPNGRIAFSDYVSGQIFAVNPDGSALGGSPSRAAGLTPELVPNGKESCFSRFRNDLPSTDSSRVSS